jgi:ABC-type nickel/cobalt efflux system permease component RcnA
LWIPLIVAGLLGFSPGVLAHPMGNFSISHYAGITVESGRVEVRYFVDMAEIPTFQELQQSGIAARLDDPRLRSYLSARAVSLGQRLHVTLNGQSLALRLIKEDVIFPPGAGNLPTMKFGFVYQAEFAEDCSATPCQLEYQDRNFPGRAGWKEIVVSAGRGLTLASTTGTDNDRSRQLSDYPTDLLNSPPQQLQARIVFSADSAHIVGSSPHLRPTLTASAQVTHRPQDQNNAKANSSESNLAVTQLSPATNIELKPNQQATPRNSFTELMATKQISLGVALLAAFIAAGLGALHALEPGHGKTIVAAYLVGSRGIARHALFLGIIVTASHTAGVYLLGAITLYAQRYILPDRIYPFLGVLSGLLIAGMGCYLFLQRYVGAEFTHTHNYEICVSGETPKDVTRRHAGRVSTSQLFLLGVTGGIVPCPAALVVLLSAVALRRTGFGLFLIVAFSIGLAAVLIAMGLAAVYTGRMMARLRLEGPLIQRWLPMGSAAMIIVLGFGIAVRGLMAAGIVRIHPWA